MKVIVGLGNPGKKYLNTRHNLGFIVLDQFMNKYGLSFSENRFNSLFCKNGDVIFCKPQTFMNNSGNSLKSIKDFYKLENSDFLIIYDDLYLETGKFKYSLNNGPGGHNGIKNIVQLLQGNQFFKLRVGIGPRERAISIADYVLEDFSKEDFQKIKLCLDSIIKSLDLFIKGKSFLELQNLFN